MEKKKIFNGSNKTPIMMMTKKKEKNKKNGGKIQF